MRTKKFPVDELGGIFLRQRLKLRTPEQIACNVQVVHALKNNFSMRTKKFPPVTNDAGFFLRQRFNLRTPEQIACDVQVVHALKNNFSMRTKKFPPSQTTRDFLRQRLKLRTPEQIACNVQVVHVPNEKISCSKKFHVAKNFMRTKKFPRSIEREFLFAIIYCASLINGAV